ncbi:putative uncharacterized protein DDB_G0291608 [Penaeus monodon]|uniref:putative uncharacterized protein DDB_G0291608 n=1 Tax=Penaeus monodon TaxID=6687 RepID=UPI0018A7781D|nr:putative uncharacterized protein DDB_G0291608 [Penaeus monodon]
MTDTDMQASRRSSLKGRKTAAATRASTAAAPPLTPSGIDSRSYSGLQRAAPPAPPARRAMRKTDTDEMKAAKTDETPIPFSLELQSLVLHHTCTHTHTFTTSTLTFPTRTHLPAQHRLKPHSHHTAMHTALKSHAPTCTDTVSIHTRPTPALTRTHTKPALPHRYHPAPHPPQSTRHTHHPHHPPLLHRTNPPLPPSMGQE